jgi:hypothetical protein
MSMWPVMWPRVVHRRVVQALGHVRHVAELGDLHHRAEHQALTVRGHAHRPVERAEMRIYGIAVGPQDHELAGLVRAHEHAGIQFAQDVGKVRRVDAAENLFDGLLRRLLGGRGIRSDGFLGFLCGLRSRAFVRGRSVGFGMEIGRIGGLIHGNCIVAQYGSAITALLRRPEGASRVERRRTHRGAANPRGPSLAQIGGAGQSSRSLLNTTSFCCTS